MTTNAEGERRKRLKRKFLMVGGGLGMILGLGYAALTLSGRTLRGAPAPPDPPGIICVNMFLILAVCVIQASIIGRLAGWLTGRNRE